jgi:hypothetical protein
MKTLRKPRLNSTVVRVALETFFSASRLAADRVVMGRIFRNGRKKCNAGFFRGQGGVYSNLVV